jgi:hypothetical protein
MHALAGLFKAVTGQSEADQLLNLTESMGMTIADRVEGMQTRRGGGWGDGGREVACLIARGEVRAMGGVNAARGALSTRKTLLLRGKQERAKEKRCEGDHGHPFPIDRIGKAGRKPHADL